MAYRSRNLPPTIKALGIGVGGLLGGFAFISGNSINKQVQKKLDNNNSKNGPFSTNSIIEEGDSIESVMNFLYFNLFISICILLLVILLIYQFKKDKSKVIIIIIITLEIFSFVSYYLAIYLCNDPDIISIVYQEFINFFVGKPSSNIDVIEIAKGLLGCNLGIKFTR